jgi:pyruvate dehydrogenase E2 component (dihydrolipoamide acetyltransferase)
MTKWGLSMSEGRIGDWLIEEGAEIAVGDEILEVETDKIAGAVEATDAGVLRRRVAEAGKVYPVKALLGVLADDSVNDSELDNYIASYVVPETAADEEDEAAAKSLFVDLDSGRLHYSLQGEGDRTVLLIHGFGGNLNNWLFNDVALAEKHKVFGLDLPGHGASEKRLTDPSLTAIAETVVAFMDSVGIEQAHLVGHSMGGGLAIRVASRAPERVASLSLLASIGFGREINYDYITEFVGAQSRRELKPQLTKLFADPGLVTRQLTDEMLKYKRLDGVPEVLRQLADDLFTGGEQQYRLVDELAGLNQQTLIVWGREDHIIPVIHAEAAPRGARVEILENAGHMVQMEQQSAVNKLLSAHFGSA